MIISIILHQLEYYKITKLQNFNIIYVHDKILYVSQLSTHN